MYNNGQRPQKMYGGGMAMRKPMMSDMKEKNIKPNAQMTMMMAGGGNTGGKPDYLDFDKDGDKKESMKQALRQKKSGKKTV